MKEYKVDNGSRGNHKESPGKEVEGVRREEHDARRRAMGMKVQGRRKSGRPKRRWLERVRTVGVGGESAQPCYMDYMVHRPHIKVGIRRRRVDEPCWRRAQTRCYPCPLHCRPPASSRPATGRGRQTSPCS